MNTKSFNQIQKTEDKIWEIKKKIDFFEYLNPINAEKEKEIFLRNCEKGKIYNPNFRYKTINPEIEKHLDELDNIKNFFRNLNDVIVSPHYINIINDLKNKIQILLIRGSKEFNNKISKLYGLPSNEIIKQANKILQLKEAGIKRDKDEEEISSEILQKIFKSKLKEYGFNWNFELKDYASSDISVNAVKKLIKIKRNAKFALRRVNRLIVHEIDTHVLRYENGAIQPFKIFKYGFNNHLLTEEGLAVLMEEMTGNLSAGILKIYAGRVIAANLSLASSFYEIFSWLSNSFPINTAYSITQRVKRGLINTDENGGLTKDYIYLEGREKIKKFIIMGKSYEILFMGKFGIEDIEDVQKLLENKILQLPKYLPSIV